MAETTAAARADDTGVRWWEPIVAFVGGNVIGSVAAVAIGIGGIVIAVSRGVAVPDAAALSALLTSNFAVIMGTLVLNNLAVLSMVWWLVRRRAASPFGAYFPPVPLRSVLLAAASGLALSLLINGGNQLIETAGWITFTDTPTERAMVPHDVVQFAVSFATVTVLAPLVEEFVFRGLLFRWLLPFAKVAGAVLVSGLVFGLIHGQFILHPGAQGWLLTVELVATGAVLGLWVARTGSLRTSFATHAAFNLTATILSVIWP